MDEDSKSSDSRYAFYVKCRPYEFDAQNLARDISRVFIGYPPWRRGDVRDRHNLRESLLDISQGGEQLNVEQVHEDCQGRTDLQQIRGNRNFARRVRKGSMVVVPRPGEGICHIGRIAGSFELVNDPPWADKWLDSHVNERKKQKIGDEEWIANVVQTWPVEGFARVPFPLIPRWISYRLLSRNTIGWIPDRPVGKQRAVDVLEQLYEGKFSVNLEPTGDRGEIEGRLLDWVSPSMFEHLVCELLQLEHPDLHWVHTGGSGDGGTDGMAINGAGQITALLQCKLHLKENPLNLGDALRKQAKTWEIGPERSCPEVCRKSKKGVFSRWFHNPSAG